MMPETSMNTPTALTTSQMPIRAGDGLLPSSGEGKLTLRG